LLPYLRLIRRHGMENPWHVEDSSGAAFFSTRRRLNGSACIASTFWTNTVLKKRLRKQIVLCPAKLGGKVAGKRDTQRLLLPHLDRVNSSLANPVREHKTITFDSFAGVWECDYLSLMKGSTQSGMRTYLARLKSSIRQAGDAADRCWRHPAADRGGNG
jgi:hypothetical protein